MGLDNQAPQKIHAPQAGNDVRHLLDGPVEQRLRASLTSLAQAENQLSDGTLVDLGPLARAIAVLAGDIQALPAQDGERLAPLLEILSGGLRSLAESLSVRAKACSFPPPPDNA